MKSYKFILEDLDCAACGKKIEDKIASKEEYENVIVNFASLTLSFKTEKLDNVQEDIEKLVKEVEPDVTVVPYSKRKKDEQRSNKDIIRLAIGVVIYALAMLLQLPQVIKIILIVISAITLLIKTAIKAFKQLKGKALDENALIVISVIGACLLGETTEGLMVILLYEIGKILESKAVNHSRKSIANLMDIKPEYANLKLENDIEIVEPDDVKIGDVIVVKAGEKVPLDGKVIFGNAKIDSSALTGESKILDVKLEDKVLSGSINIDGLIEVKVEKNYENSTVNQILNLVENATDRKAKTETTVSKMAKVYTPVVLILAIVVAVFMPLIFKDVSYTQSIYKALTFLVISCPCSIAISVPLSYFSGIGKSSKNGILVKGSDYLDGFRDIGEIIFDKTGTITTGKFVVNKIESFTHDYSEDELLKYFAIGESFSNHPIAKSILNEYTGELDTNKVKEYKEIAGRGIEYKLEGKTIKIGNNDFAGNLNLKDEENGTNIYLSIDGVMCGRALIVDEIKQDAKKVIEKLNKLGIITKMFTGDSKQIALEVAKKVGIQDVESGLLPQDKYEKLEKELEKNGTNKKVAFVGDGINDSPVLARSDIGISMGGIGSNAAIEASDVVIMTDELSKIIEEIKISKKTNKIIKQNLIFAIVVKILILVLSVLGIANMWQAVFADVGVTLITILNTLRILK